jgi:predicted nucleic acid-binding protein
VVLVDSSIWVEYGRGRSPELAELIDREEAATCPAVVQELLQGMRGEPDYKEMRETLLSMHMLESPMSLAVFEEAAQLYRACRAAGYTIRSPHDCLIAVCAIRNNVPLLQADHDFEHIARVSPLRLA